MADFVAQALALKALSGGTGNAYTKSETDALLGGKADLVDGKVPAAELPSYVDDVLEYSSTSAFPATGESGKIYVATDTNRTYRWGGSAYVEISESLALGETSSTAYAGSKGKANADAIAAIKDGSTIDSFGDVETALSLKADSSAIATVATSGNYNDLSNKPALGTASASNVATSLDSSSDLPTAAQVSTALGGKQAALTTAQQAAADSGITAAKVAQYDSNSDIVANLAAGLVLVAHQASTTSSTLISLSYTAATSDFSESSSTPARYTGTYLVHCVNWGTTGQPYIGLLTYSGNDPTKLTKTDIVTGFAPTITLTDGQIDISGCARISIYAMR